MEWIVAPAVKAGDRVAIIAPASPVSVDLLEAGIAVLRSWDLVPVVHPQVWSKQGYLAGSDEERADALVGVLDDPSIAAVVCAQGGYGCTRLLELLPISRIGAHNLPSKRFFGFSDITALHSLMRVAVPGYVSFYAPMLATSYFAKSTELSRESLRLSMFAPNLQSACPPLKGRCLQMGRARSTNGVVSGRLVGGNLTVFTNCLATPWQEDMERCILILEDGLLSFILALHQFSLQ
uniref:LD-carboxypeptidase N-terminal domain-containing protein n=1 Tax=Physcomitrium patens TaxID=3218 RepID=A0A7I4E701_PHYPA